VTRSFSIIDCEQRSADWFTARAGVVTASEAADMLSKPAAGKSESAKRRDLRVRKALELLTGKPCEEPSFVSADMRRGAELEPEAVMAYEVAVEAVQPVGFLRHIELPIGCSPDGIVGDYIGGLELKCPKQATHWGYLQLGGALPADYLPQITHSLFVTDLPWWDFASYHPDFPEPLRLYRVRVPREKVDLNAYALAFNLFWSEVEKELARMRELVGAAA
jgi:hypothetical protein